MLLSKIAVPVNIQKVATVCLATGIANRVSLVNQPVGYHVFWWVVQGTVGIGAKWGISYFSWWCYPIYRTYRGGVGDKLVFT